MLEFIALDKKRQNVVSRQKGFFFCIRLDIGKGFAKATDSLRKGKYK